MEIRLLRLQGDIEVNCYLIEHGLECYIVDPGYQKETIRHYVGKLGLKPLGILLTHAHLDHIGAVDCFSVPVYVHEADRPMLEDDRLNGFEAYGLVKPWSPASLDIVPFGAGAEFKLGDLQIRAIHTPGHTPGCACFGIGGDLLTGDTLFASGVGRWDFPGGDLAALRKSIVSLVDGQAEAVRIHPGHGSASTIGREKRGNPYYREWKSSATL